MGYTLNLKKVSNGYYERNSGEIRISISNPYVYLGEGSNAWECWIEVEGIVLYNEWFELKRHGMKAMAEFINQF